MRLTVFGASGRTGVLLVEQALARGDTVTAVVRGEARLTLRHPRLTVTVIPDLADTAAVSAAVAEADAVLSAIGARGRKEAPVATPATRAILRALGASSPADAPAAARRVVVVSAAPVGPPPPGEGLLTRRILLPVVGRIFRAVYDDLAAMERELAASGTRWTALRPARLTNGPHRGRYRTALGTAVPHGYSISRADLADATLATLDRPETEGTVVGVAY